jgi:hypothetical protein
VRHSEGLPIKRANSVYPRRHVDGDIDADVALCESYYSERRLPSRFQVSPASQPAQIKDRLLERGYRAHSPTDVYICDLSELGRPVSPGEMTVELSPIATAAWWSTSIATLEIKPEHQPATARLFERIAADTAFVHVVRDGVVAHRPSERRRESWECAGGVMEGARSHEGMRSGGASLPRRAKSPVGEG